MENSIQVTFKQKCQK